MSELRPKVSIIVPVFNTAQYLQRCFDSLVHQTLQDIEIIVVNDGSTDESETIIEQYKKTWPEKFVCMSQKNSGQAAARNRALELCSGEYIGFLDSDDYYAEDYCERLYAEAKKYDADYVACGYTDTTNEDGTDIELNHYVASKVARCQKDLFFGALVSPFIHLYRGDIIRKTGIKFPEGVVYEDTAFYVNLIPYIKNVACIKAPLAYRLRHKNSTTTTFKAEKVEQIFLVIDDIIEYYKKNGFWDEWEQEVISFCVRILTCSSVRRIGHVKTFRNRYELSKKTLAYLNREFPDYKKNKYFSKGKQGLYIRSYSKLTAGLYAEIFHIMSFFERKYS